MKIHQQNNFVFFFLAVVNTDPCKGKCGPGKECHQGLRPDGGTISECRCITTCSDEDTRPVCGSDGTDYGSECELYSTSCITAVKVKVVYQGMCGEYFT